MANHGARSGRRSVVPTDVLIKYGGGIWHREYRGGRGVAAGGQNDSGKHLKALKRMAAYNGAPRKSKIGDDVEEGSDKTASIRSRVIYQ